MIHLVKFDLKYIGRKTIKGSVILDFWVENPVEGEGSKEDFPDKNILNIELRAWKIYFNAAIY